MKITCVTAVFNAIKSGNRENLIRCVRSVAALKTPHEHLIYDGGSTDGTVELLRELEKKIGGENRWTKDGLSFDARGEDSASPGTRCLTASTAEGLNSGCGSEPCRGGENVDGRAASMRPPRGDESGALIERALPENDNSAVDLLSRPTFSHPRLRVVSEPDTGIYNALNKGVRDAKGKWLSVLGCDDYYSHPEVLDSIMSGDHGPTKLIVAEIDRDYGYRFFTCKRDLKTIFCGVPCAHMGMLMDVETVRQVGGFDESLKIGADQDLFFKMMETGSPFKVEYRAFANFAYGGASGQFEDLSQRDLWEVFRRHLRLTDGQLELFKRTGYHSPRAMIPLLRSPNWIYRQGARYMLWTMVRHYIRLALYPVVVVTRPARRAMREWHR